MKSLLNIVDYIKKNKKFNAILKAQFSGYPPIPIYDYGVDPKDHTLYFFTDDSFEKPYVYAQELLKDRYKMSTVDTVIACEELKLVDVVGNIYTEFGNDSFGEPDAIVLCGN